MKAPRMGHQCSVLLAGVVALGLVSGTRIAPSRAVATDGRTHLVTALTRPVPQGLDELRAIEQRVRELSAQVMPATVSLQVGSASGSGVVISEDGYILTAGHVCANPGRNVTVIFPDGKRVRGITLGVNTRMDSGLIQITDEGEWPYVEMARSSDLKVGAWTVATGHPGGFDRNRPGVVRLGRIIRADSHVIQTDCTLVGGDSGGPLFNMDGKVIGIHSRIGSPTVANFHVPVDTYRVTWDRLARGDRWGDPQPGGPFIGINGEDHGRGCRITETLEQTPAFQAGLRIGDVITDCNGEAIQGYAGFVEMIGATMPGDQLELVIERDHRTSRLTLTVGARPEL